MTQDGGTKSSGINKRMGREAQSEEERKGTDVRAQVRIAPMRRRSSAGSRGRRRAMACLITISASALIVAGCGSSGSGGGDSGSSAGSSSGPIKVMMISDVTDPGGASQAFPVASSGAKATVDYFNANGGIHGRKIDLDVCDAQTDPTQTATCARQAITDGDVAVVASYSLPSQVIPPILAPAKLPYMPAYPEAADELTSPISFPTTSSTMILVGMGYIAGRECQRPVLMFTQDPAEPFFSKLIAAGVSSQGKHLLRTVVVPTNTTDYSPIAQQALAGNPDCVIVYGTTTMAGALYPALKQAGAKQRIIGLDSQTIGNPVDSYVPSLTENGIDVSAQPPYSSSAWSKYKSIMAKYGQPSKNDYSNGAVRYAYQNLLVFRDVLNSIPAGQPITRASILAALHKTTSASTEGLSAPFNFTKPLPVKGYERTFNTSVTFSLIKNGQVAPLPGYTGFFNMAPIFTKAVQGGA
jgi:branched-chain amino acid transport system substrate-binding protein